MNQASEADGTLYVAVSAGTVRVVPRATQEELRLLAGMRAANRRKVKPPARRRVRHGAALWTVAVCAVLAHVMRLATSGIATAQHHTRGV